MVAVVARIVILEGIGRCRIEALIAIRGAEVVSDREDARRAARMVARRNKAEPRRREVIRAPMDVVGVVLLVELDAIAKAAPVDTEGINQRSIFVEVLLETSALLRGTQDSCLIAMGTTGSPIEVGVKAGAARG